MASKVKRSGGAMVAVYDASGKLVGQVDAGKINTLGDASEAAKRERKAATQMPGRPAPIKDESELEPQTASEAGTSAVAKASDRAKAVIAKAKTVEEREAAQNALGAAAATLLNGQIGVMRRAQLVRAQRDRLHAGIRRTP